MLIRVMPASSQLVIVTEHAFMTGEGVMREKVGDVGDLGALDPARAAGHPPFHQCGWWCTNCCMSVPKVWASLSGVRISCGGPWHWILPSRRQSTWSECRLTMLSSCDTSSTVTPVDR